MGQQQKQFDPRVLNASSSFFVSFLSLLVQHDVMSVSSSWFLANLIEWLSTSEHQCFPFCISSLCHLYFFLRLVHSITPFEENKSFLEKVSLQNHSSPVNTCLRRNSRPCHVSSMNMKISNRGGDTEWEDPI